MTGIDRSAQMRTGTVVIVGPLIWSKFTSEPVRPDRVTPKSHRCNWRLAINIAQAARIIAEGVTSEEVLVKVNSYSNDALGRDLYALWNGGNVDGSPPHNWVPQNDSPA